MLDNKLIESAIQLTGKTMDDMEEVSGVIYQEEELTYRFSYPKFFTFLLSPEFIEKYEIYYPPSINKWNWIAKDFWQAIYEYKSWNEEPLIDLLKPLCKTTNND